MSQATGNKRQVWREAHVSAVSFQAMLPKASYVRWEYAGSLRRGERIVGDIDHVVIPAHGEIVQGDGGLFALRHQGNLLWAAIDEKVKALQLRPFERGGRTCWGDLKRSVDFAGLVHEVYTAEEGNFGIHWIIRTGPAEFSRMVVTRLNHSGTPSHKGWIRQGAAADDAPRIQTPTEEDVFRLAGMSFIEPRDRNDERWWIR